MKIVVEKVTVVKFRVDNRGSNPTGCFRIKVRTDTAYEVNNAKCVLKQESLANAR